VLHQIGRQVVVGEIQIPPLPAPLERPGAVAEELAIDGAGPRVVLRRGLTGDDDDDRRSPVRLASLSVSAASGSARGPSALFQRLFVRPFGPLAFAETGDRIRLSVKTRSLDLLVDAATMAARRAKWQARTRPKRGWDRLVHEQVMQAPDGADLRFLRADGGASGG
jgi:hypothetical protein